MAVRTFTLQSVHRLDCHRRKDAEELPFKQPFEAW
jgi:hypothetical protein